MNERADSISSWLVLACLAPSLYATLRYGFGASWYRSALGIVIFSQWLSIDIVLLYVLSRRLWADYPGHEVVRLVVFASLLAAFVANAVTMETEMRSADLVTRIRKKDAMPHPSPTPNVVVENPTIRRVANIVLGAAGIVLGAVTAYDVASAAVDLSEHTVPIAAVYSFLVGTFGLAVTTPNIPKH